MHALKKTLKIINMSFIISIIILLTNFFTLIKIIKIYLKKNCLKIANIIKIN